MRTAASRTSLLGWSCIGLGLFMAGTPFVSPVVGTPFDGLPALAWSTDRAVLHVLPGLLSVILGVALLSGRTRIEGRWRRHGLCVDRFRPATADDLETSRSTWSRRLIAGQNQPHRDVWRLALRRDRRPTDR